MNWKYYDDYLSHPKDKEESNFMKQQSPNKTSYWTNSHSFQNYPTNIIYHPFCIQKQSLQQQKMSHIGNDSYQKLKQTPFYYYPNNTF